MFIRQETKKKQKKKKEGLKSHQEMKPCREKDYVGTLV